MQKDSGEQVYDRGDIRLIQGDAIACLQSLPDNSADYCVCSPPYFQMMTYRVAGEYGLEQTVAEYVAQQVEVFAQILRVLKEGAIASIVLGDTNNNYSPIRGKGDRRISKQWSHRRPLQQGFAEKEALYVPDELENRLDDWELTIDTLTQKATTALRRGLKESGWRILPQLIWDKGTSDRSTMLGCNTHEQILMLMKQSKGRRLKPLHLEPFESSILRHSPVWDSVHPCPYPASLVKELISHCCPTGGTVVSPYVGSGTDVLAAYDLGRKAIGIDLDCSRAKERLEINLAQGDLFGAKMY